MCRKIDRSLRAIRMLQTTVSGTSSRQMAAARRGRQRRHNAATARNGNSAE
jgi:hypothetical protein